MSAFTKSVSDSINAFDNYTWESATLTWDDYTITWDTWGTGLMNPLRAVGRSVSDTITTTESFKRVLQRFIKETLTYTERRSRGVTRRISETLSETEAIIKGISRNLSETVFSDTQPYNTWDDIDFIWNNWGGTWDSYFSRDYIRKYVSRFIRDTFSPIVEAIKDVVNGSATIWTKRTKPSTSWTERTKPSTIWTNRTKP